MMTWKKTRIFQDSLLAIVLLSGIFYGSAAYRPFLVIKIAIGLFGIARLASFLPDEKEGFFLPLRTGIVCYLFFLSVCVLQVIPLPQAIAKIFSPQAVHFYHLYGGPTSCTSISLARYATLRGVSDMMTFGLIFMLAASLPLSREDYARNVTAIIITGFVFALHAIIVKIGDERTGLVLRMGTFANRNHFASYLLVPIFLGAGSLFSQRDKTKMVLMGFAIATMGLSVFFSSSRGGILSLILGLCLFVLFGMKGARRKEASLFFLGILLLAGVGAVVVGPDTVLKRFADLGQGISSRVIPSLDALKMIREYPAFGIGLSAFKHVYPFYQSQPGFYYEFLHNDILQIIVETGAIGSGFFFAAIISFFFVVLGAVHTRHDLFMINTVFGGVIALWAVFMHSMVEFNFHSYAIPIMCSYLMGVLYRGVFTPFNESHR